MPDRWYYVVSDKEQGPVSREELKELVSLGVVQRSSEVWKEGSPVWVLAAGVPDLFPARQGTAGAP